MQFPIPKTPGAGGHFAPESGATLNRNRGLFSSGIRNAEVKHINTLKDCIQACKTSANFLSRNSANHMKSCAFCAEICKLCAKSCEAMPDDKKMKACADECRTCAESCDKMANMK